MKVKHDPVAVYVGYFGLATLCGLVAAAVCVIAEVVK